MSWSIFGCLIDLLYCPLHLSPFFFFLSHLSSILFLSISLLFVYSQTILIERLGCSSNSKEPQPKYIWSPEVRDSWQKQMWAENDSIFCACPTKTVWRLEVFLARGEQIHRSKLHKFFAKNIPIYKGEIQFLNLSWSCARNCSTTIVREKKVTSYRVLFLFFHSE